MADQYTKRNTQALLGLNVVYEITTTGTGSGVTVTAGDAIYGDAKDIIAAAAVLTEFWVCSVLLDTASAAAVFDVRLADATLTVNFAAVRFDATAATVNTAPIPIGPFPVRFAGSTQITAVAGDDAGGTKTINVGILYAVGL